MYNSVQQDKQYDARLAPPAQTGRPIRERLQKALAILGECFERTSYIADALEPTPPSATGNDSLIQGPMGVEQLTTALERDTELLLKRLQEVAAHL